jgi:BlaI family penicillinase repressor
MVASGVLKMPRPRQNTPTEGELEILKVLWDRGPLTVREVLTELNQSRVRAYTSVMSLMNIMTDKGLLERTPQGRAFLYRPTQEREETLGTLVQDLLGKAFEGSASSLVAHMLDQSQPSPAELDAIRKTLEAYERGEAP